MFTGLIETVGTIKELHSRGNYTVLRIASSIPVVEISIGESIACDGSCLTVVQKDDSQNLFTVEASQETASKTILASYRVGSSLNLERSLKMSDRLGGHFVSGHIDGIGQVDAVRQVGESLVMAITHDNAFDPLVVEKGSIAIMGVSLTVNTCRAGWFEVNLIPHTVGETNLSETGQGQRVNLEFDLIGKYIVKMQQAGQDTGLKLNTLIKSGW